MGFVSGRRAFAKEREYAMAPPLISVIIPVFNMEAYLTRCLDSVLANTYQNLEILCVDDGSKDRSLEILREYAEKDPRIIVIAKENGGVSSARNAALDRISGDYIAFIDPDDFVHPQYFELLLHALEKAGTDLSICGFRTVEDKDLPLSMETVSLREDALRRLNRAQIFLSHLYRSYICVRLLEASLIHRLRFRENLSYSEDSVFFAELAEQRPSLSAVVVPEDLYFYYQREGSLVKQVQLPERCKISSFFAEKALSSPSQEEVYLDQAIKRNLSTWYLSSHILPDRDVARTCRQQLKPCLKRMRRSVLYSEKQKLLYSVFCRFPQSYWLYRSITEPDMWAWEKVERKKRRAARRGAK